MKEAKVNGPIGVRITLESRQDGGRPEKNSCRGQLYVKPNAVFIRYEEHAGTDARVATTVRWDGQELRLLRRGAVDGEQAFASGKLLGGVYRSQAIALELETDTAYVKMKPANREQPPFTLEWGYGLRVNGQPAGQFEIKLSIREE